MNLNNIFLDRLPKIDLHGFDKESARVKTNDFIDEALKLEYKEILIIHGIGEGIVRKSVHDTLSKNKSVLSYELDSFNVGCTIVYLKDKESNNHNNSK